MRIITLLLLVAACLPAYAQRKKKTDTLWMRNGTVVVGELKAMQVGIVQFKATSAGTLSIKRHNVRTINALNQDFKLETLEGDMYFGPIFPSPLDGHIRIGSADIPLTNVYTLADFEDGLFRDVQGQISAGYSFTRSSNLGRLNTDGSFRLQSRKFQLLPNFSSITSFNGGSDSISREREDLNITAMYDVTPFIYPLLLATYERNLQLGLNRRFSQGVGVGTKLLLSPSMHARVMAGIIMNQERYNDGRNSGNIKEVPVSLTFNIFRYTSPNISFYTSQGVYFGIKQHGRTRQEGETRASWEIINDFNLNITFYNSYDSRPSVAANGNFDLSTVISVGYTF
ncbi:DUF481 domain-containing protein [Chitinophaga lutea]